MSDSRVVTPDSASEDLTGRTIGGYLIVRRLGRGGMAEVYLAEQFSLRRHVALKVLKSSLAQDASFVQRFHQEAQAAAALIQSNIVQIYEVGDDQGVHFIAQEYVRGQNLKQYMQRYGAVDPVVAVNIIRQVSAALQKAADNHVVHRDIKPENIMLVPNGEVKVADFGLARVNDRARASDLTQIGITMGTPLYMSPEQVEGRVVDTRSDLYSLGITSYHMLAGQPPFEGENPLAIALQHVNKAPTPLHVLRPDVPLELCQIIERMMAKEPADRFQSPQDLIREMRKIEIDFDQWDALIEKLSVEHGPEPLLGSTPKFAATRQLQAIMSGRRPSRWSGAFAWWILGAVLLGGAGGAALAYWQPVSNPLAAAATAANRGEDPVPRKASAREQYEYAFFHPELKERGWLAVREYFENQAGTENLVDPETLMYFRLADERLGEYYLSRKYYESAYDVYQRLASAESYEPRFQAIGHMGLAIIYDALGKGIADNYADIVRDHLYEVHDRIVNYQPPWPPFLNEYLEAFWEDLRNRYVETTRGPPVVDDDR